MWRYYKSAVTFVWHTNPTTLYVVYVEINESARLILLLGFKIDDTMPCGHAGGWTKAELYKNADTPFKT